MFFYQHFSNRPIFWWDSIRYFSKFKCSKVSVSCLKFSIRKCERSNMYKQKRLWTFMNGTIAHWQWWHHAFYRWYFRLTRCWLRTRIKFFFFCEIFSRAGTPLPGTTIQVVHGTNFLKQKSRNHNDSAWVIFLKITSSYKQLIPGWSTLMGSLEGGWSV